MCTIRVCLQSSFKQAINSGLRNTTQVIGSVISMYLVSPKLTLYLLVAMPLAVGIGSVYGEGIQLAEETFKMGGKHTPCLCLVSYFHNCYS